MLLNRIHCVEETCLLKKKNTLNSLILVEALGTKRFIKQCFLVGISNISEVGMVVKLMSKETGHSQDRQKSSSVIVMTRMCEN